MAEFSWIQGFSLVTLMLQLVAAACFEFIVREGGEVTLSCENVSDDQDKCDRTTWLFSKLRTTAVTLFEHGEIHTNAQTKSPRLSVTANCSLLIRNVTAEDAGQYTCRRYNIFKHPEDPDTAADLCVVSMTEHKDADALKLNCSVAANKDCKHYTVGWFYEDVMMSQSTCSASVNFTASHYIYASKKDEFVKCRVTFIEKVQEFTFRIQPSAQKMAWWALAVAALGLAALVTGVVIAIRWKRAKGIKLQKKENAELDLNSAVPPSAAGTSRHSADPEGALLYASISCSKNTNSRAQVPSKDDDEENEAVIYSIMKPPTSSSFGPYRDS